MGSEFDQVDDFGGYDTTGLGEAMQIKPSENALKEARMRETLAKASPKAMSLGKGRQILNASAKDIPIPVIAELTKLSPADVRSVVNTYAEIEDVADQREFKKNLLPKRNVFDLYERLQDLFEDIQDTMKFMDDPELKLGYIGEQRQLFKLAKEVLQDVTFKKQQEQEREAETQLILDFLDKLDPKMATELFKALKEHRDRRKAVGGG